MHENRKKTKTIFRYKNDKQDTQTRYNMIILELTF